MDKEELGGCASGCGSCSGCGHDHDHAHEDMELPEGMSPVITLTDEEGNDVKFEILDVVVLDDETEYLVVTEHSEEEKDDVEVVILSIKEVDGEEVYDTVTDEKLAEKVFNEFTKQQEDMDEE